MSKRSEAAAEAAARPGGGWCPLCGAQLGTSSARDPQTNDPLPPSLRLEVAGTIRQRPLGWRLTVCGTSTRQDSTDPPFVEADVRWTYMLCGNGHYFLDSIKLPGEEGKFVWRKQSFVAAIGPVASGKSYLLTRTLNQPLAPSGRAFVNEQGMVIVERIGLADPLEAIPKDTLEHFYSDTRRRGVHKPMPPTLIDELIPGTILRDYIGDDIPDAAKVLQEKVMKRARSTFDAWGRTIRQPIMLRAQIGGRPSLTCVADLAGELFRSDDQGFRGADELPLLRNCSALIWVVDPFHSDGRFEEFLQDAVNDDVEYQQIAEGSSRPDERRSGDLDQLRTEIDLRDEISEKLATEITKDIGTVFAPVGGILRNLIAITKCDLVERALHKADLADLGEGDDVREGIACYLEYLVHPDHPVAATDPVQRLLDYLRVAGYPGAEQARFQRVNQVADALLAHYSEPGAFWDLVHAGKVADVLLRDDGAAALDEWSFRIPSLDEHLVSALQPGGAVRLQMRDLVMSAVGCGLMFGLGHERHVNQLFKQRWRTVQFFLCSPLGTVPKVAAPAYGAPPPGVQMLPSSSAFPRVATPSAALTQLQLHVLREAMP